MGNEKLEKLRLELAIGEEQADRGEFVEDYDLEDLLDDLDNEARFFSVRMFSWKNAKMD